MTLHTDKGGEFKSRDLESICTCNWRGIVHTFTDIASHQVVLNRQRWVIFGVRR